MVLVLAVVFVVIPLLELFVIIQVSHAIGVVATLLALIGVSVVGAWLSKRQGLAMFQRVRRDLAEGRMPGVPVVDGLLVLAATVLLTVPGFVTDAVGLLLLVPPVRAAARNGLRVVFLRRLTGLVP